MSARILGAALAVASLSACAPMLQSDPSRFNATEVAWASGSGSGSVVGEAFMRRPDGGVATAEREAVALCPDSPYGRQANAMRARGEELPRTPDRLAFIESCRDSTTSESGQFAFHNLPAGTYSVATRVRWFNPGQSEPSGGFVHDIVTVREGRTAEVVLTR